MRSFENVLVLNLDLSYTAKLSSPNKTNVSQDLKRNNDNLVFAHYTTEAAQAEGSIIALTIKTDKYQAAERRLS